MFAVKPKTGKKFSLLVPMVKLAGLYGNDLLNKTIFMFKKFFEQLHWKTLARQLRRPKGTLGHKVASKMNEANEFLYYFTLDQMELRNGLSVLEIGFGNGKFFDKLFNRAQQLQITGIDFSDLMVKAAIKNNETSIAAGKLSILKGQSDQLPFADNSFDIVFCINVAYFWNETGKHLQEINRVLKPGGKLYTTIRTKESIEKMPFTKYGFKSYTEEDWKLLAHQHNLLYKKGVLVSEPAIEHEGSEIRSQSLCLITEKKNVYV